MKKNKARRREREKSALTVNEDITVRD